MENPILERVHLIVSGDVQGVLFRVKTLGIANNLGLTGWVKNTLGGGVEIVAEGKKEALEELASWCKKGPPYSRVENVEITWEKSTGEFSNFDVRY
jgi:acylphosphatase